MSQKGKGFKSGKQILLLGLVALVITAGYYRWTIEANQYESIPVSGDAVPVAGEKPKETGQGEKTVTNIEKLKAERDKTRGEMMEEWKKTAQSSDAGAMAKKEAEAKLKSAAEFSEKETSIEILIQSKGYRACFAHINENGVTVVVGGGELDGSKVAQMKDIIVGETGVEVRNIKISAE